MEIRKFFNMAAVKSCVADHQQSTFTHFVTYNKDKTFGDEDFVPNVSKGRVHYWSHSGKTGVPIEYDGVPFMHVGRWSLICHQGKDMGVRAKIRYIEKKKKLEQEGSASIYPRKSSSKKVNCPAEIYISHVVKYPQFKVPSKLLSENSLPTEQLRRCIKDKIRMKHKRDPSKVIRVHCYFVRLPNAGDHQGHPFVAQVTDDSTSRATVVVSNTSTLDRRKINKNRDKHRRTREPMDRRVTDKLLDLIKAGYYSIAVIRAELNKFVIQELFAGEAPPPAMFRRYNPTSRDIQNALHKVKQESHTFQCAQLRSHCSDALKNIATALSTVDDETKLANLYKHLMQISKQFSLGTGGDAKSNCSVSVHQLSSEDSSCFDVVTVIEECSTKENGILAITADDDVESGGCFDDFDTAAIKIENIDSDQST